MIGCKAGTANSRALRPRGRQKANGVFDSRERLNGKRREFIKDSAVSALGHGYGARHTFETEKLSGSGNISDHRFPAGVNQKGTPLDGGKGSASGRSISMQNGKLGRLQPLSGGKGPTMPKT